MSVGFFMYRPGAVHPPVVVTPRRGRGAAAKQLLSGRLRRFVSTGGSRTTGGDQASPLQPKPHRVVASRSELADVLGQQLAAAAHAELGVQVLHVLVDRV